MIKCLGGEGEASITHSGYGGTAMDAKKTNKDVMTSDFSTIKTDADLKKAFDGIRKSLDASPYSFGLVVTDNEGKYAGVLTVDEIMTELRHLYRDACDKPGGKEWMARFFDVCELKGIKKVSEIMGGKRLSIGSDDSFEKSCELILYKKLNLLTVVDAKSKPVGIITRRQVLTELGPRMFR
jgi:predicted transcriptional regulator